MILFQCYVPAISVFLLQGKLGELLLSLCYEPNVGRLTVIVIKAKDLKAKDITGASGELWPWSLAESQSQSFLYTCMICPEFDMGLHFFPASQKYKMLESCCIIRLSRKYQKVLNLWYLMQEKI